VGGEGKGVLRSLAFRKKKPKKIFLLNTSLRVVEKKGEKGISIHGPSETADNVIVHRRRSNRVEGRPGEGQEVMRSRHCRCLLSKVAI